MGFLESYLTFDLNYSLLSSNESIWVLEGKARIHSIYEIKEMRISLPTGKGSSFIVLVRVQKAQLCIPL